MEVFIVYGTNSGGTLDVAKQIASVWQEAGHTVHIRRADSVQAEELRQPDFVFLGSCTWEHITEDGKRLEGQLQQHMRELVEKLHGVSLHKQNFAVYGLGDESYQETCAAADHLEKLVTDVGGKKIGATLRLLHYFYDLDKNRQRVQAWATHVLDKANSK
ncbi:MAG: flavodoxin family protein [Candidatus Nomurabacteria bacterium]|nr:MAG: flavodoxin family protein [Candidatus Nomurabacteria bacterium]